MSILEKIEAMSYKEKILYFTFFCEKYVNKTFIYLYDYIEKNREENDNDNELPIKMDFDLKNQYVAFYLKYYNNKDFDFYNEFFIYFFKMVKFLQAKSCCVRGVCETKKNIMTSDIKEYLEKVQENMIKLFNKEIFDD